MKWHLKVESVLLSSGCYPCKEQDFLIQDVEHSNLDKVVNHPYIEFAMPAWVTHWCERISVSGQLWTSPKRLKNVLSYVNVGVPLPFQSAYRHLEDSQFSCIVWWTHENTPLDRILQSGKCLLYSTAACALPLQTRYTIYLSQYSAWENKRHWYDTSQLTVTVRAIEYEVASWINLAWLLTQGQACARYGYFFTLNGYSTWNCKKMMFFSGHYLWHWCFCLCRHILA